MAGYFELNRFKHLGEFYFTFYAPNGRKLLTSIHFANKESALNGVMLARKNGASSQQYVELNSSKGKYYFVLESGHRQELGYSRAYDSALECKNAIDATKRAIISAEIKDKTICPSA